MGQLRNKKENRVGRFSRKRGLLAIFDSPLKTQIYGITTAPFFFDKLLKFQDRPLARQY